MTGSASMRILTADDHPMVREGIAGLVEVQPDVTLVAEAANGRKRSSNSVRMVPT
jgi:DNA-binding NarL/FixJ family response regulator